MKLWSMLLLVVLTMLLVISCGDDDKGGSGKTLTGDELVRKATGTWICTQSTDTKNGKTYEGLMVGNELTINTDYTYSSTSQDFGYNGTYSVEGDKISAHSNSGKSFVISVSVIGNQMTWKGASGNNVTFSYTFQRANQNYSPKLSFTKDLIAGDFSWKVADFIIQKGTNSDIQKEKEICFNVDGTCTGFSALENAWRINDGVVETFNKETNTPIYTYTLGSHKDGVMLVRINGANDFEALVVFTKEQEESTTIAVENYWNNTSYLEQARVACYAKCAEFEHLQFQLEEARIITGNRQALTPYSSLIANAWQRAYNTIDLANSILENVKPTTDEARKYIAEIKAIRAFVYYNLAMLWGNVPLITTSSDTDANPQQSNQFAVYNFAYNEISEALMYLTENSVPGEGKLVMGKDAGLMLATELQMALGNLQNALAFLTRINKNKYVDDMVSPDGAYHSSVIWSMLVNGTSAYHLIYTYDLIGLYEQELSGDKDNAINGWGNANVYAKYGCWAALKRLGIAKEVTGCEDYELLMPIPVYVLQRYQYLKQNPGY